MSEEKTELPDEALAVRGLLGMLTHAALEADEDGLMECLQLAAVVRGEDGELYLVTTTRYRSEPAKEDRQQVREVERMLTMCCYEASQVVKAIVARRN